MIARAAAATLLVLAGTVLALAIGRMSFDLLTLVFGVN